MEVETDAEYFDFLAGLSQFASLSRFIGLKFAFAQTNPGNDPRRGSQPPSWSFYRGIAKGGNLNPPFAILSFDRQRRFLSHAEKESGVETFPAHSVRG